MNIQKGVPQGSILGPILLTIYVNNLCPNVTIIQFHFYADGIMYSSAASLASAIDNLQSCPDKCF